MIDIGFVPYHKVQPTNLEFQLDNMQLDWTFEPNRFDYIHGRMLSRWVKDPGHLCREALQSLQPGGILEIQDLLFTPQSEDDSSDGTSSQIGSNHLLEAGFTDVQMQCLSIEDVKEVGKLSLAAFTEWAKTHAEVECSLVNDIHTYFSM